MTENEQIENEIARRMNQIRARQAEDRAYGRAWEATLGWLAGANEEWINNEVRECRCAMGTATMENDGPKTRALQVQLLGFAIYDIERCHFDGDKTDEALDFFRRVLGAPEDALVEAHLPQDALSFSADPRAN